MIREARLNTLEMFKVGDITDNYQLWQEIAEYINGETAYVIESEAVSGSYVFLGLKDEKKNKELFYMMEQDSVIGVFTDDREGFDKEWDSGDYEHDGCFYIGPENLIFDKDT